MPRRKGKRLECTDAEVLLLDQVLSQLRRGGDARLLARSSEFRAVADKVKAAKESKPGVRP